MKALTVQQPYAHLIALPDDHPDAKRVENRVWATSYVDPVAIHAGKGDAAARGERELLARRLEDLLDQGGRQLTTDAIVKVMLHGKYEG